jgi:hypothetical protein
MGADKGQRGVFAVLRHDGFHGKDTPLEHTISVKEIVCTQELAEEEVARLNSVQDSKGVHYWWQYTRLYPDGESAGTSGAATDGL